MDQPPPIPPQGAETPPVPPTIAVPPPIPGAHTSTGTTKTKKKNILLILLVLFIVFCAAGIFTVKMVIHAVRARLTQAEHLDASVLSKVDKKDLEKARKMVSMMNPDFEVLEMSESQIKVKDKKTGEIQTLNPQTQIAELNKMAREMPKTEEAVATQTDSSKGTEKNSSESTEGNVTQVTSEKATTSSSEAEAAIQITKQQFEMIVTMLPSLNPDLKVLSSDQEKGIIVIKDTKTGETQTLDIAKLLEGGLEKLAKQSEQTETPAPVVQETPPSE